MRLHLCHVCFIIYMLLIIKTQEYTVCNKLLTVEEIVRKCTACSYSHHKYYSNTNADELFSYLTNINVTCFSK